MTDLYAPSALVADRYQIVAALGRGSMGTTYAAVDRQTDQQVAIKVVSLRQVSEWKVLELFEREARVLASLQHPSIPNYIDYFQIDTPDDRRFHLVQELVAGESLLALSERGWRPEEAEAIAIAAQVLTILDYLHNLQPPVIHRDLKPENLIRTPEQQIALVDFGAVQEVYRTTLSRSGTFVGTLGYMPPEQFHGQTSAASDLYSLGATLVFLLSGQSPADLPRQRLKLDFRSQISVSPAFGHWLDRMLEPALEDRFASAAEALAALDALQGEPGRTGAAFAKRPEGTIAQPPDSNLLLRKTRTALQLEIPNRSWWRPCTFSLLVVNLLWNAIAIPGIALLIAVAVVVILDTIPEVLVAILVAILMALPIGCIGLVSWLLWRMLRAAKGDRILLTSDPQTTTLQYSFWPAKTTLSAATCDVELRQDEDRHAFLELYYRTATGPTLRRSRWSWPQQLQRPTRHRFGQTLTAAERAWLYRELSSFLTARHQ